MYSKATYFANRHPRFMAKHVDRSSSGAATLELERGKKELQQAWDTAVKSALLLRKGG